MAKGKYQQKNRKKGKGLIVALIIVLVIVAVGGVAIYGKYASLVQGGEKLAAPWAVDGEKNPEDYSYEEFQSLTMEQQIAFQRAFASEEAFQAWLEREAPTAPTETEAVLVLPWEAAGAKQPSDYTWAEFEALDSGVQIAFQNTFGNASDFEAWMQAVNPTAPTEAAAARTLPWEEESGKELADYTWEEYEQWDGEIQIAFQNAFTDAALFQKWMDHVHPTQMEPEEDENSFVSSQSNLAEYTWNDFQSMTVDEQMAFQNAFPNAEAFENWMKKVNPEVQEELLGAGDYPWETPGAKQPEDYTWEEFEQLTGQQQMAFQSVFESDDAFVAWYEKVHP